MALATETDRAGMLPIAPYEADLARSRRLPWVDFRTGDPIRLDWQGSAMAATVPVMRLSQYIETYHRHPETKAADADGNPAGPETVGLLYRLRVRSRKLARIGKEVDRLDEDEGASLELEVPMTYERDDLSEDIAYLAEFCQATIAREIGMSERRWRDIARGSTIPRDATAARIVEVASDRREKRRRHMG